jgi:hypothetical protein
MMIAGRRWIVRDRYSNSIYLTQERWEHIIDPANHPEMEAFEEELQKTIQWGLRKQNADNPKKYRYSLAFDDLDEENTHIVAIVLFGFSQDEAGQLIANNYVATAYQKEVW